MNINDLSAELIEVCEQCIYAIHTVRSDRAVDLNIKEYTISYAFLKVHAEWEWFLEQSFITYMLGGKSNNGYSPQCFVTPVDRVHAEKIIRGDKKYADWSASDLVLTRAETYFSEGKPFKTSLQGILSQLKEMKKVRNALVHKSKKSMDEFDTLVRNNLSAHQVGISIPQYLITPKKGITPYKAYYEVYFQHIINATDAVSNI